MMMRPVLAACCLLALTQTACRPAQPVKPPAAAKANAAPATVANAAASPRSANDDANSCTFEPDYKVLKSPDLAQVVRSWKTDPSLGAGHTVYEGHIDGDVFQVAVTSCEHIFVGVALIHIGVVDDKDHERFAHLLEQLNFPDKPAPLTSAQWSELESKRTLHLEHNFAPDSITEFAYDYSPDVIVRTIKLEAEFHG